MKLVQLPDRSPLLHTRIDKIENAPLPWQQQRVQVGEAHRFCYVYR
ncbi:MAG TPA: hypothetical protein VL093_10500 [Flavipsychrobacter sp.]|nr:hypothetical protein [Flavipsychrobacter sp.]